MGRLTVRVVMSADREGAARMYPDAGETGTESELLHVLMSRIEEYVLEVCSYLRSNGTSGS